MCIIVILLSTALVSADMEIYINETRTADEGWNCGLNAGGDVLRVAQSFNATESIRIGAVSFNLRDSKNGPTEDVCLHIQTDNANKPSDTPVSTNATLCKDADNFPVFGATTWITFNFTNASLALDISADTKYWIVLNCSETVNGKRIEVGSSNGGVGTLSWYTSGAGTWANQNTDMGHRIWNNTLGGGAPPGPDYFTVSLKDEFDNSSVLNFTAIVNGTSYNTTNGTITTSILNNASVSVDVNISSDYAGGYFNKSLSHDVTTDLTTNSYQAELDLYANEKITGLLLTGVFKRNGTVISPLNQHLKAGNYNFSYDNSSYYNASISVNISALSNSSNNITGIYDQLLNLTVENAYSGERLFNFTGYIYQGNHSFNESIDSTPNNYTLLGIIQELPYTLYVEHPNYAISNSTNYYYFTSINETTDNITMSLYSNNSIMMYIRNEATGNLITDNITITITFNSSEDQYWTANGTYFIDDLLDGNYSIKFSGGNYTTKTYTVTVADRSTQILNAYLSASYQQAIFTLVDSLTINTIESVSFQMARIINSSWAVVESKTSDITGRVQVNYLPDVRYRFTCSKTGYETKIFYLDPIIFSTYTIQLSPTITQDENRDYAGISVSFSPNIFYNNQSTNFTFSINAPEGDLESYNISVSYPGGNISQSGTNAIGEVFTFNFTITGATFWDKVNVSYYYDSTTGGTRRFFDSFQILGAVAGVRGFQYAF